MVQLQAQQLISMGQKRCTVSGTSSYKKYDKKLSENDSMYQPCELYKNFKVFNWLTYTLTTNQTESVRLSINCSFDMTGCDHQFIIVI